MTDEDRFILKPILPYAIWLGNLVKTMRLVDDEEFQKLLEVSAKRMGYSNIAEYRILMRRQFQLTQVPITLARAESLKRDAATGQIGLFQ